MTPPDALTISRFLLAGLIMGFLFAAVPFGKTLALVVFVAAAITDALDGWLARRFYGTTAFGSLLDPLADKVLVCAAFVSFVQIRLPGAAYSLVPAWITVLILAREFLVTGLRVLAASGGRIMPANAWGKQKTIWQLVVIIAVLVGLSLQEDLLPRWAPAHVAAFTSAFATAAYVMALAVAAITVMSGAVYFHHHRALFDTRGSRGPS